MNAVNLKSSLIISLLSSSGLLALLVFTPVENSNIENGNMQTVNGNASETPHASSGLDSEDEKLTIYRKKFTTRLSVGNYESPLIKLPISVSGSSENIIGLRNASNFITGRYSGRLSASNVYQVGDEKSFLLPDYFQLNHPLTKDLSIKIQSEKTDNFNLYASTGLTFSEANISTSIKSISGYNLYNEISTRDSLRFNPVAWEASIAPVKNLQLLTSVIDTRSINAGIDAAKIGMVYGLDKLAFNVKYAYATQNPYMGNSVGYSGFRKNFFNLLKDDGSVTDSTSLGFTLFLDNAKNYSVYLGNQFYNSFVYQANPSGKILLPSTMATFKGRANGSVNYFFNFQNQPYKEYTYIEYGLFKLPLLTQSTFDYATVLGLEHSF